ARRRGAVVRGHGMVPSGTYGVIVIFSDGPGVGHGPRTAAESQVSGPVRNQAQPLGRTRRSVYKRYQSDRCDGREPKRSVARLSRRAPTEPAEAVTPGRPPGRTRPAALHRRPGRAGIPLPGRLRVRLGGPAGRVLPRRGAD